MSRFGGQESARVSGVLAGDSLDSLICCLDILYYRTRMSLISGLSESNCIYLKVGVHMRVESYLCDCHTARLCYGIWTTATYMID